MRQTILGNRSEPNGWSGPTLRYDRGAERLYVELKERGAIACLAVEVNGAMVEFEGLIWRGGRVLSEVKGTRVVQRGGSVDAVLRDAVISRIDAGPDA